MGRRPAYIHNKLLIYQSRKVLWADDDSIGDFVGYGRCERGLAHVVVPEVASVLTVDGNELAVIVGEERASIRMATVAGISGAVVGMIAAQVNASTAPPLAEASVTLAPTLLPSVWLQSEIAGGLGLQLRLISDVLVALWLTLTGLTLVRTTGWRALGAVQLAVSVLVLIVYIGKPFDWVDLEPTLGFVLALVYLWIGIQLLRRNA